MTEISNCPSIRHKTENNRTEMTTAFTATARSNDCVQIDAKYPESSLYLVPARRMEAKYIWDTSSSF
ncbi:MAG: hypothetical protein OEV26_01965 [Gallionella sp.]|nr:hypothetical protein [Gallionella sp.]